MPDGRHKNRFPPSRSRKQFATVHNDTAMISYSHQEGEDSREELQLACLQGVLPIFDNALSRASRSRALATKTRCEEWRACWRLGIQKRRPARSHSVSGYNTISPARKVAFQHTELRKGRPCSSKHRVGSAHELLARKHMSRDANRRIILSAAPANRQTLVPLLLSSGWWRRAVGGNKCEYSEHSFLAT